MITKRRAGRIIVSLGRLSTGETSQRTSHPSLPIRKALPNILHLQLLARRAKLVVRLQPPDHHRALGGGQKLRGVREVLDDPEGDDPGEHGREALEDEDPRPAGFATDAVHLGDGGCEEAAEGAGDGRGGEEDGGADAELAAFVPAASIDGLATDERRMCEVTMKGSS